jgi:DNA-binding NarL/FixJ family response regulator
MIRMVIADDQTLVRTGFQLLLDSEEDIEVIGQAQNGAEAVELTKRLRPDVVLMDVRMPVLDGIEATRRIAQFDAKKPARVLVITTYEVDEYVFLALRAGASGFLLKDTEPADLIQAVRIVAAGDALISPKVTRRLIEEFASLTPAQPPSSDLLEPLTDREREVMAMVGKGLSNHEIAVELFVSPATVRTHVSRAMTKLHARDRAQLVVFAYESGLVTAGNGDHPARRVD